MDGLAWTLVAVLGVTALALAIAYVRQAKAGQASLTAERQTAAAAVSKERERSRAALAPYAGIVDVEKAIAQAKATLDETIVRTERERRDLETMRLRLTSDYDQAKATYDRLKAEVSLLEENLEDISFGVYKPHYDFDSPERYREELERIRAQQKELIRLGGAGKALVEWSIGGSRREGEKMQRQYLKLMLRAFNGESDATIARVTWSNVTKMEERIEKSFDAINTLGEVMQMVITRPYLKLKLAELRLEHEYAEKKRAEQEEQRRIREQMREEERALREAEKAKAEAEAEEARNLKALERANAELALAQGAALQQLQLRIAHLDAALQKARDLKDKATTMAQLTRAGHVYVISNLGSFGEDVFKIGMTRRLEPVDRIRELGDASVPFDFDIHAMIYSEDAPTLEGRFHSAFAQRAINLVNPRKEFFAVSFEEVERVANENGVKVQLTKLAEARDYRQTLALREASSRAKTLPVQAATAPTFPATI